MDSLNSLQDLLIHELRDLHSAETQLTEALPKMERAASHDELKTAFKDHLEETRRQVERLDRALSHLSVNAGNETCEAMKGLIEEGSSIIEAQGDATVKDAALIGAAQRVEHYEIAAYGTAKTYADLLGHGEVKSLLDETLDEEAAADKKLNKLATGGWLSRGINREARSA
jgi:ferritin-like metal-binding protein YciE